MDFATLFFIAIGLSMDAFAVSVTEGFSIHEKKFRGSLRIGLCFGIFQAIMPILGWMAGMKLEKWISAFDHWVAFGLLAFVGIRMIAGSYSKNDKRAKAKSLGNAELLMLGVATSIDALAVGLSFGFLKVAIVGSALFIGLVTFSLSFVGVLLGRKIGDHAQGHLKRIGGVILIAIGLKILAEHLLV
jgi:manganese efflux pump family protein